MDIFTIKQWLFVLTVINFGWWVYVVKCLKDFIKEQKERHDEHNAALGVLKKDNETLYKELKRITRDIPQ